MRWEVDAGGGGENRGRQAMSTTEQTAMGSRVGRARLARGSFGRCRRSWWDCWPSSPLPPAPRFVTRSNGGSLTPPSPSCGRACKRTRSRPGWSLSRRRSCCRCIASASAAEVHFLAGSAYYRQALASPPPCRRASSGHALSSIWTRRFRSAPMSATCQRCTTGSAGLWLRRAAMCRGHWNCWPGRSKGAGQPLAGYQLLQEAYLKLPTPDLDGAIEASRRALELTDDHDPRSAGAGPIGSRRAAVAQGAAGRGNQGAGTSRRQGIAALAPQGAAPAGGAVRAGGHVEQGAGGLAESAG